MMKMIVILKIFNHLQIEQVLTSNIFELISTKGSFTNTTIVGTCSDTEKEEENEEEEEEDEKEVTMESSLFNENSKMVRVTLSF